MSTELAVVTAESFATEKQLCVMLAESTIVPPSYRKQPANVLVAVGLGRAMGLSPAESLYRIDVIQGTPAAGAELIASNVRKAGHKIRTTVNESEGWAETTIVRSDDPDYPTTIRRDMAWAKKMGLDTKDNYRKQAATMLGWRSITACARLACSEALYGVAYTADELTDSPHRIDGAEPVQVAVSASSFASKPAPPVADADVVEDADVEPVETVPVRKALPMANRNQLTAALDKAGIFGNLRSADGKAAALAFIIDALAEANGGEVPPVKSTADLTVEQAGIVLDALAKMQSETELALASDDDDIEDNFGGDLS